MIKSLENVLKQFKEQISEEDRNNLKQLLITLKIENLPKTFRFKHVSTKTDYTAKLKNDVYEISWIENGKEETTTYSIAKVKEYIEKGIWVLQGEVM